ncbi:MAG: hypothetical protein WBM02_07700 [bacterium]
MPQGQFRYLQGAFKDLEGPIGGNVSSLLWCPVTPGRLWCGTVAGELYFKDSHSAWHRCEPPFRPMMKVESIEMVTGAEPALLALSNTGSLAASIDDGHTWMHNLQGLNEEPFRVIRRHPLHAGYVMAGARNNLFFSPDNGRTWGKFSTKQSFTFISAIEFSRIDPLLFFVADSDGFSARVLMTTNGGFTFTTILEGETLFNQIHSLIYRDSTLWVGGSGFGWQAARAVIGETISWHRLSNGLPVTAITCMAGTPEGRIVIGSNGSGLYCFSEEKEAWKRIDIEPKRRYVSCLSAASGGLAAGFLEYGVALESSGDWVETNEKLYARNISRLQQFGEELLAVADEQLFIRTGNHNWNVLPGFQLVQDVLAHGSRCFTTGLYSGVFQRDLDPGSQWNDLKLPAGRAMLVRTSSKGDLFVMTLVKRDRFRFFLFDPKTPDNQALWKECCPDLPVSGFVNDFAVDYSEDIHFITVSTSQGMFCYDSYTNRWLPSQLPEATRVSALFRSRHNPDVLYAATGRILLKSLDFGRSFEEDVIGEFPSKISSLTVSGLNFESIWISTENGGIYVSHYPNCWNALQQDEVLLPINQIAVDTINQGFMNCGTQGVSCRQLAIPSIAAQIQKDTSRQRASLHVYGKNPGPALAADLHCLLIKPGTKTFSYLKADGDLLKRSSKPWPVPVTLDAHANNIELFTFELSKNYLRKDTKIAVALCFPEVFHPICDIQLALIG